VDSDATLASPRSGSGVPAGGKGAPPPSPRPAPVAAPTGKVVLEAGGRIGKYDVKRKIGQGGMGAVFEGVDRVLKRSVALKVLPDEVACDPQALKRFVREAQAAASLNHPNVVTVFDIAQSGSTCYIAMELVPGQTVQDVIERGPLEFRQATRLALDCGQALAAAHRAGLVHRDVKPANILVTREGKAKLSDFGLAKNLTGKDKSMTNTQAIVGTPNYMSPEQCEAEGVDWRSDLYSLGATYFAMLTGRPPFDRGSVMKVMYAHCHEAPPDPRSLLPSLPAQVTAIIQRAMAKEPGQRYQSADEFLNDLKALIEPGDAGSAGLMQVLEELSANEPPPQAASGIMPLSDMSHFRRPWWTSHRVQLAFFLAAAVTLAAVLAWLFLH
jgi:serine/threonine protein kinase